MPEISEQVSEALEHAEGGDGEGDGREKEERSKLNSIVAASVAVVATFMAVCNVKAGNVVQAMGKTQIEVIDTWSFFQAKSTKQSLAEAAVDQLSLQRETSQLTPEQSATLDKRLASYREKVTRYEGEKADLKKKVDELEKDYERLNVKDDQFDISESLLSVAIAMLGITALTQKRKLLFVAMGFAGFGLVVGLSGFFGWNLRPEWLAKIIGA
jgi:predicted  nucleic acid-binding Zn-ribbon protein